MSKNLIKILNIHWKLSCVYRLQSSRTWIGWIDLVKRDSDQIGPGNQCKNWVSLFLFVLLRAWCILLGVASSFLSYVWEIASHPPQTPRHKCLITPFSGPWRLGRKFTGPLASLPYCEGNPAIFQFQTQPPVSVRKLGWIKTIPDQTLEPVWKRSYQTSGVILWKKDTEDYALWTITWTSGLFKTRLARVY